MTTNKQSIVQKEYKRVLGEKREKCSGEMKDRRANGYNEHRNHTAEQLPIALTNIVEEIEEKLSKIDIWESTEYSGNFWCYKVEDVKNLLQNIKQEIKKLTVDNY